MAKSDDPFDEVVEMVQGVFKAVSELRETLGGKVDDDELRDAEKTLREYTDSQIKTRHDDQSAAIKQLIENMGSSLLTDFEEMGRDIENRLLESQQRFIDTEITPLVGRLVEDEMRRKAEKQAELEKLEAVEAEKLELKEKTERMERRERIYKIVGAVGVVFGIIWYSIRIYQAVSGAG